MNRLIRLTIGQALVRFMARQYVERDREENRFIEGVAGLCQGIVEFGALEPAQQASATRSRRC